jgi:hypothetical protein
VPEVNDAWDAIFLGAFLFGLLFTLVSLILGVAHLGLDLGHHGADFGHGGDGGTSDHGPPLINVSTILAFVAWFGGIGFLAHNGAEWSVIISVLVAILGGLVGGYIVYQFFARVIRAGEQAPLDPRDFRVEGRIARVSSSIRAGGTGEIIYEQGGSRAVRAARAADGRAIPRGTEVVILRSERGVGIVSPWNQLMDGEDFAEITDHAQPDQLPQT